MAIEREVLQALEYADGRRSNADAEAAAHYLRESLGYQSRVLELESLLTIRDREVTRLSRENRQLRAELRKTSKTAA